MSELFDLAFARLDRAESRRSEFAASWASYIDGHPWDAELVTVADDTFEIIVKVHEPAPSSMALAFSDWLVQSEEAKHLIAVGRIPQLRLALILLDSAVELIMHRMVEAELDRERFYFDRLKQLRRLESWRHNGTLMQRQFATNGPSNDQLATEIQQLAPMVTSTAKRKRIDGVFGRLRHRP